MIPALPFNAHMPTRLSVRRFAGLTILLGLVMVAFYGCAKPPPMLPSLGADDTHLPGKVVWHDLVTPDLDKAKVFYTGLFGWSFEDVSEDYALASNNGRLVAGLARLDLSGRAGRWLPLVSVTDIDGAYSKAVSLGAEIAKKPFDLPGRGRIAVLKDPQEAAFGIVQSSQGDPKDRKADFNEWLWDEIWTDNVRAAAEFYHDVLGYEVGQTTLAGTDYRYLKHGDLPRVGLLKMLAPELENTWVSYIRVEDVKAVTAKVETLGGQVLVAPQADIRDASLTIITDPSGAGLILQEWTK